jgi:Uma2 family endonuclease
MTTTRKLITAEEFIELPDDGRYYELVRGELIELPPPGAEHGQVCMNFGFDVKSFLGRSSGGVVISNDSGIILGRGPDTVRGPDICYYGPGRLPGNRAPKRYPDIPPDLVVEVISPFDRAPDIDEKIQEWLAAGVRLVWAAYTDRREVVAHLSPTERRVFAEDAVLTAEPVLPGFACPVARLFDG